MFADNLESFRLKIGLSVKDFSVVSHISPSQLTRYRNGSSQILSLHDSIKLLASFPGDITIAKLAEMTNIYPVPDVGKFPEFTYVRTAYDTVYRSNKKIRNYILNSVKNSFNDSDTVKVLSAICCQENLLSTEFMRYYPIWKHITDESQFMLMNCLRTIRDIKMVDIPIPYNNITKHFNRSNHISSFADLCCYENIFSSGGIFMLFEMMFDADEQNMEVSIV